MGIGKDIKILVIGGSGFIGAAIVRRAISMGWEVDSLGLTLPDMEKRESLVNYLSANITKPEDLKILTTKKYQYIVNTGGYIDHSLFFDGGDQVLGAHFDGLLNIVKSIDRSKLIRFINIGSSDEYGDVIAPQSESARERPISPYSAAKVAAAHFLQMLHKTDGFPGVSLRLFLCYGPGQDRKRFLPYLILSCLANDEIRISPGEQLRDYCFIEDVVDAVFTVFANENAEGKIFNIASGKAVSIRQVVETMVDIIGSGKPNFGAVPYRKGESMELYADIKAASETLTWAPKTDLSDGLRETISFYKNQNVTS
jgi:nucleoside-diphosphate-sugar epimerase